MTTSSIIRPFYGFFDSFYSKNKKILKGIILIEPTKLIITSSLKTDNHLNQNWLFSKRLNLILTENKLYLGNIVIDRSEISGPEITYYSSYFGLIKYQVFQFRFNNKIFLLGTGTRPRWRKFFKVDNVDKVVKNNNYILLLISIVALAMIIYSIFNSLSFN